MIVSDIFLGYAKILLAMGAKTSMYVCMFPGIGPLLMGLCNTGCIAVLTRVPLDSVLGYETRVPRLRRRLSASSTVPCIADEKPSMSPWSVAGIRLVDGRIPPGTDGSILLNRWFATCLMTVSLRYLDKQF